MAMMAITTSSSISVNPQRRARERAALEGCIFGFMMRVGLTTFYAACQRRLKGHPYNYQSSQTGWNGQIVQTHGECFGSSRHSEEHFWRSGLPFLSPLPRHSTLAASRWHRTGKNWPAKHTKHAKKRRLAPVSSLRPPFTCGAKPQCLTSPHFVFVLACLASLAGNSIAASRLNRVSATGPPAVHANTRSTSVLPPLHLRSTSVSFAEVEPRLYGGRTEVERRYHRERLVGGGGGMG